MTPLWTHTLTSAQALSFKGRFSESLALCSKIMETHSANPEALMSVGTFLLQTGFLTNAHECFTKAGELLPKDPRPIVGLANHAREAGEHEESRRLHTILLQYFPENPVIRRNAFISIEYDPAVTDLDRLGKARAWGEWAMLKAGEKIPRPGMKHVPNALSIA
jgi:tetratricopeptide (TPR) repeat protein